MSTEESAAPAQKRSVTVSGVLGLLSTGHNRKQIQEHYGLSNAEARVVFTHAKIKGRKTSGVNADSFELVDDTDGDEGKMPAAIPSETTGIQADTVPGDVVNSAVEAGYPDPTPAEVFEQIDAEAVPAPAPKSKAHKSAEPQSVIAEELPVEESVKNAWDN